MDKIAKNIYRTHSCGDLRKENAGEKVTLSGWINTVRDHGGITFVDLRDHYGRVQLVLNVLPEFRLSRENVIKVEGKVRLRGDDNINEKIPTGEIEVVVEQIELLGECKQNLDRKSVV